MSTTHSTPTEDRSPTDDRLPTEGRLEDWVRRALGRSGVIDLTTIGRRTGQPRRIEIFLHSIEGHLYISGIPRADRPRAWLLNVAAHPEVTIHLKLGVTADIPGRARVIDHEQERRAIIPLVAANWGRTDIETMVAHSPLIEVVVPGFPD
jgi:deazaflavin-dependent oxidoreductase (nitroreductase family)